MGLGGTGSDGDVVAAHRGSGSGKKSLVMMQVASMVRSGVRTPLGLSGPEAAVPADKKRAMSRGVLIFSGVDQPDLSEARSANGVDLNHRACGCSRAKKSLHPNPSPRQAGARGSGCLIPVVTTKSDVTA